MSSSSFTNDIKKAIEWQKSLNESFADLQEKGKALLEKLPQALQNAQTYAKFKTLIEESNNVGDFGHVDEQVNEIEAQENKFLKFIINFESAINQLEPNLEQLGQNGSAPQLLQDLKNFKTEHAIAFNEQYQRYGEIVERIKQNTEFEFYAKTKYTRPLLKMALGYEKPTPDELRNSFKKLQEQIQALTKQNLSNEEQSELLFAKEMIGAYLFDPYQSAGLSFYRELLEDGYNHLFQPAQPQAQPGQAPQSEEEKRKTALKELLNKTKLEAEEYLKLYQTYTAKMNANNDLILNEKAPLRLNAVEPEDVVREESRETTEALFENLMKTVLANLDRNRIPKLIDTVVTEQMKYDTALQAAQAQPQGPQPDRSALTKAENELFGLSEEMQVYKAVNLKPRVIDKNKTAVPVMDMNSEVMFEFLTAYANVKEFKENKYKIIKVESQDKILFYMQKGVLYSNQDPAKIITKFEDYKEVYELSEQEANQDDFKKPNTPLAQALKALHNQGIKDQLNQNKQANQTKQGENTSPSSNPAPEPDASNHSAPPGMSP